MHDSWSDAGARLLPAAPLRPPVARHVAATLSNWSLLREGPAERSADAPLLLALGEADGGATIPRSSHPGEGRCSIRSEGTARVCSSSTS